MKTRHRSYLRLCLLHWYDNQGRNLPWRKTKNPYHIWLSEVMLQQTQVTTVIPYYTNFLKTFPTLYTLGRSKISRVLKLWEGLGYYSRGRNLHQAARLVQKNFKGHIPTCRRELESLPGIGRSTAGAILSLAYNQREPILDGNVKRVLSRLFAVKESPKDPHVIQKLWVYSEQLLPLKRVSDFNQALMDLGATVCTPKNPQCHLCPIERCCLAKANGEENLIPVSIKKKPVPHRYFLVGIVKDEGKILIQQRPHQGLLGGLWEFPTFELDCPPETNGNLTKELNKKMGFDVEVQNGMKPVSHTYTHFKGHYHPFLCLFRDKKKRGQWLWVPPTRIYNYPFSKVYQKMIQQMDSSGFTSGEPLTSFDSF